MPRQQRNSTMATAAMAPAARVDWPLSNPWTCARPGLAATGLALAWVRLFGEAAAAGRYLLILAGLVMAGGAITLRLHSSEGAFLEALPARRLHTALLALALAGIALLGSAS